MAQQNSKSEQSGIKSAAQDAHEARVSVPGADGVDARLDNRQGAQRPPLEDFPAKPQQVDGPDVLHQVEHTARTLQDANDDVTRKGMFSPGPHGLSDEDERRGTDRAGESGGTPAKDGETGSPAAAVSPGKPAASASSSSSTK